MPALVALVALAEAHARGGRLDALLLERARTALADGRVSAARVKLAARLDALAPRTSPLARPKSYKTHRRALSAIELELRVLEDKLVAGSPHEGAIRDWVGRALGAEASAFNARGYGAAGDPIRDRIDELLRRAWELGPDVVAPAEAEHGKRRAADEARRRAEAPRFSFRMPARPTVDEERTALARELRVDLAAPADEVKRRLRALAREHHPDLGGRAEVMCKVNRLRELIGGAPCQV